MKNRILLSCLMLWIATAVCPPAAMPSTGAASSLEPPGFAGETTIAGHWEGAIEIPGTPLAFDIDFAAKADGTWSGDISIPAQNATDLLLDKIAVAGKDVSFEIAGIPGTPAFKGELSDDALKIAGQFTQGGLTFPFSMTRSAAPKAKAAQTLAAFDGDFPGRFTPRPGL